MKYNGGKNGSGVYQRLICMIPPHDVYVELFLGSGAILRRKRPAEIMSYGYELNPAAIAELAAHIPAEFGTVEYHVGGFFASSPIGEKATLYIDNSDGLAALRNIYCAESAFWLTQDPARTVIYADPPYLLETRKSKAAIYQFEMFDRAQHTEFLDLAAACPAKVLISAYENALYNRKLRHWRREQIPTTNRAGRRTIETVYMNFPEPFELHDFQYVGADHRERWRITKKLRRWEQNFRNMPALERYAILGRLNEIRAEFGQHEIERDTSAANRRKRIARRRQREQNPRPTPDPALRSIEQELF
jgi:DNA adenine methylase